MSDAKLRLDKYLWAIRIFKTRTQAAHAITDGKVKCNKEPVKPSRQVNIGDNYEIKAESRPWIIQVTGLPDHRAPYSEAIQHYLDLTPADEIVTEQKSTFVEYTGKRHSKQGRPTKKNRRGLEKLYGE